MSALRFYNTLTKKIEDFKPLHDAEVGLYTCGPTVYNTAHIGNLRTYIFEDILRRTLEFDDFRVKHVMNITDVGHLTDDADMGKDKIEERAKKENKSAYDIAARHTKEFFDDLNRLNIELPTVVLKATETIGLQVDLIKKLEAKGVTYRTSDGIYFDTSTFAGYSRLSGQKAKDKKAGARVEVNIEKKHPTDFALWKFSKPEDKRQMEWPSPWGTGFPGWHIECSAMSISQFPDSLDIHCGGVDHIAVHHENEIAQNEASEHENFVKVWMHGEFLKLPGKRMGKSEGNSITLQNVIDRGINPLAYRYLCLQTHYRKPLSFTWESLEAAQRGLSSIWFAVDTNGEDGKIGCAEFEERFKNALHDDLNTPKALAVMQELLKSDYPWSAKLQSLSRFDRVLGLGLTNDARRTHFLPIDRHVQGLLGEREKLRQKKDWDSADEKRKEIERYLAPVNVVLEDTPDGPRLRKK